MPSLMPFDDEPLDNSAYFKGLLRSESFVLNKQDVLTAYTMSSFLKTLDATSEAERAKKLWFLNHAKHIILKIKIKSTNYK